MILTRESDQDLHRRRRDGFPIKAGEGRFVAEAGSDASIILADLQKALEAKKLPELGPRSTSLSFTFVNLGDNQSQAAGGGFSGKPSGNRTAMKIFIGDGDQEAEVYLNFNLFNLVMNKGQFSMKDPDYEIQCLDNSRGCSDGSTLD